MSAAAVLPYAVLQNVWAFAQELPLPKPRIRRPPPNLAFYRKYTEALLRRYVRMSLEAGRVPSLLGQEMFRAKVTHFRVGSFEDVVIFLHDIEHCLEKLSPRQQHLVARISLQEFTVGEVSAALGVDPRTIISSYRRAIDRLTEIFLSSKILEPQKCCQ
ncbi:MAG: sigma factor-like helix-turn-helix DNA-binding protein [Acidobacteriaceae bacterium]